MTPPGGDAPGQLRFIHISSPSVRGHLNGQRSSIHAHAARVTRARRRQARNAERQEETDEAPVLENSNSTAVAAGHPQPRIIGMSIVDMDLLSNSAGPVTSTERFLINHYIMVVIPDITTQCTKLKARGQIYMDALDMEWITFALRDSGFRNSALLRTCRHLSSVHQQRERKQEFDTLATRYKLVSLQTVRGVVSSGNESKHFSDSVVAQTLELAHDEIQMGEMALSRIHLRGAFRMAELNGGARTLGLNGFLETVLYKSMREVGLLPQAEVLSVNLFMLVP